jgi:predicted cupin superfamily sugar epimerase
MNQRASVLIEILSLKPHPEGGYYTEIFRSPRHVTAEASFGIRNAITSIYFLILEDEPSRWHRVMSDEVWHFLEGSPAEIFTVDPIGLQLEQHFLGPAAEKGQRPAVVIPAGHWQGTRTHGDYTLAGCTVGPGFDFSDFKLLRDEPALHDRFRRNFPELPDLL